MCIQEHVNARTIRLKNKIMRSPSSSKHLIISAISVVLCCTCFAKENLLQNARKLQHEGRFDEAIEAYKDYLSQPVEDDELTGKQICMYADALVQMMNTYQSKGEPDACIAALQVVCDASPVLQETCERDFYSVMGYALSRTENMREAEATMLKALTLPLNHATPERYFRDYAYAAAVFYSNPDYQTEVIKWCEEALTQARSSANTSGQQWVMTMLGSLYKKTGNLNKALELFQDSKLEAESRNDDLGVLNSLNSLIDLFLYFDIPEYADLHATEAINIEKKISMTNPMVSAQIYINKGRALYQLGQIDSVPYYAEKARKLCESLPYNSGMVDVNLLNGIYLTEIGGDSMKHGLENLENVTRQGTAANRAKAYHQLAQTYLEIGQTGKADVMLDSLNLILTHNDSPIQILHIDYKPILDHYLKKGDEVKLKQYVELMLHEQQAMMEKNLNYNLVEAIVDLQTGNRLQELKIMQLKNANQRLWMLVWIVVSVIVIAVISTVLLYQKKKYVKKIRNADKQLASLVKKLNQSNVEKEKIAQEVNEFLNEKDNRHEMETLTPYILKESGEVKFRQCFELLYPLFLPRLREKVPSVSRREELLSMLIALKQDNKNIAELLAIAPRSVLMLRHRFRQKIGMTTELSLENFIEDLLD